MTLCIVYYSATGNTRTVAEAIATELGGTLIPVRDLAEYTRATLYLLGAPRALRGERAEIEPARIDASAFDLIVVAGPVWAFRPTPAVNAAITALEGCEEKKGFIVATSGGMPGKTLALMTVAMERRGIRVAGGCSLTEKDVHEAARIGELIGKIRAAAET
jgi:flavorubredoxin